MIFFRAAARKFYTGNIKYQVYWFLFESFTNRSIKMKKQRHGIASLLRKGGPHKKSKSGERQKLRKVLRKDVMDLRRKNGY